MGSSAGSFNYHDSGGLSTTTLSRTVNNLPTNGSTVHVTLWYESNGWKSLAYTYQASSPSVTPSMSSPATGSILSSTTGAFTWSSNGANVSAWQVTAGSSAGGTQYHDSGQLGSTVLSRSISGLPSNGSTVHVRLRYQINNVWSHTDYTYTAFTASSGSPPSVTSPTPASTLSSSSATFNWQTNGSNVTSWQLLVGSSAGGSQYHDSSTLSSSTLSRSVSGLPSNGSTVHVRLRYQINNVWSHTDYTYTAFTASSGGTLGMSSPSNGSTLSGSSSTFTWSAGNTSVTQWWLYVGSSAGSFNYHDSGGLSTTTLSRTVNNLPTNGSTVHVTLWYESNGWKSLAYTYQAHNANAVILTDPFLLQCFGGNVPSNSVLVSSSTFTCDGIDLSTADLTQLAQLPNLRTLDLSHTKLTNISGLAGLTQLTNLNLGFNNITNISALAGMTQLQTLNLSFNTISDISALAGMNSLQALYLDANNLTTISALANKPALTKLYVDANQLTSITTLASSPNLTELGLSHNQLSTITTLSGMSALQMLALDGNNLSTISALSGLSSLQTLYLRSNLLTDVAALAGLSQLQRLELGFNNISALPSLSSMTALQHLGAEDNAITNVSPLSGRTTLKSVALENNLITSNTANINSLKTLSGLNTLIQLDHNRLLDVNGLTTLGGSNTLALTLADNCLGTVTLPSRINVVGRSWQFPASRCAESGVNNPPIAYDKTSVITQGATVTITLDAVDPDAGDTLSYALVSTNVSNGTLNTSNAANGSVTFTASATHTGSAGSFTFRVTDAGGLQSAVATITLQISEPPPSVTNALLVQRCFGGSEPTEATLLALSTLNCTAGGSLAGADFADLSDVPNLTELSVENAGLTSTDLAALAQALPNLTKLTLSGNQISDVSGLAGMTQLATLLLDDNQLTDVSGLTMQNFPALIRLNLSGNTFDTADFTVLGTNLPNLIMLFLDDSQLDNADLTALFGTATAPKLSSMYYLVLRNNSITSIEPLLHLAGVSTLLLDGNNIMDIAALSPIAPADIPMPVLAELSINANRLSSIAVPRLGSLSTLSANQNCLSSAPVTHTNSPPPTVSWTGQRALVSGVCPVAP